MAEHVPKSYEERAPFGEDDDTRGSSPEMNPETDQEDVRSCSTENYEDRNVETDLEERSLILSETEGERGAAVGLPLDRHEPGLF